MVTAAFIDLSLLVSWDFSDPYYNQDCTFWTTSRSCWEEGLLQNLWYLLYQTCHTYTELTSIKHFPLSPPLWSCSFLTWAAWGQQASVALEAICPVICRTWSLCSFILWMWAPCPRYRWGDGVSALQPVDGDWERSSMSRYKPSEWNHFHAAFPGNKRKWGLRREPTILQQMVL